MLNGLDLFSGIGGISLALGQWARPVAYCEIDEYARAVLLSRMADGQLPTAPIWDDIRTFPISDFRGQIDIVYGGFPCQDLSCAGTRKGLEAERSGLFFEIMRLAEEIRPTFIFLENVPGIRKYLHIVAREMASLRYDCRWGMLSAYDVGAPHKRERWFLLANANSRRCGRERERKMEQPRRTEIKCASHVTNPNRQGLEIGKEEIQHTTMQSTIEPRRFIRVKKRIAADYADSRWWAVEPDVGRVVDGLPFRVDRIKALGNAVVPAQVSEAFKRLMGL